MLTGLLGQKGRIHFSFGKPIHDELIPLGKIENKLDQFRQLASLIDEHIYRNYKLWPVNYAAYDVQNKSKSFTNFYTNEDKCDFINYVDRKLS